jgi:hypothetical protein
MAASRRSGDVMSDLRMLRRNSIMTLYGMGMIVLSY